MKEKIYFKEILKKYNYKIHEGDIVAGTIIHSERCGFLVDIGTNKSGYLPVEEVAINFKKKSNSSLLLINTTRDFFLVAQNQNNTQNILSLKRLDYIRAWKRIKQLYLEDIIFKLKIEYVNKGGIITYLEGIQGFIPKSHIFTDNKNQDYNNIKQKNIKCKLLNFNDSKNQLILSNKSAKLSTMKHRFKLGEIIYGEVIVKKIYGIFLSIHNINALLHNSEISHQQMKKANGSLNDGKFIKVKIIYLNNKEGLISVSIRNVQFVIIPLLQYS
uniref:Ribosomal protein S1 n=1 Tax=Polysiphonia infestans TaxID=2006978 RepID=A0A1Z1MFC9_9FLOR|nr:ribosomal protein S1 [Polysiphonia infestans]ARW64454.1 ribosomal protein S1 [Polysiphonia infestans]